MLRNIPAELQALPQWVCYKTEPQGEKLAKRMFSPVTDRFARSNDETTWSDIATAIRYMQCKSMDGLAFALKSGIAFIDLDHVLNPETGAVESPAAREILSAFPCAYTELSASGTGIHILCSGRLPENARNRNDRLGIEMYDTKRFVCFTGNVWGNRREFFDCTQQITEINRKYVGKPPEPVQSVFRGTVTENDSVLIAKIMRSKQSGKFSRLYAGDTGGYESHSQADSALVWLLAFWTRDRYQIDRIFRTSGLYRPKWDRKLYDTTYGASIIDSALAHVKSHKALEMH